jgi:hypothetical protein
MRKSIIALLVMFLLMSSNLFAEVGTLTFRANVFGAGIWADGAELKIVQAVPINVNIYCNHAGGTTARQAWLSHFIFTSTGPDKTIIWGDYTQFPTTQFISFWNAITDNYIDSWDGILPDKYGFTGYGTDLGYPNDLGEILIFSFSLKIDAPCDDHFNGTICIEQGNTDYDWLFEDPIPIFAKTCWDVEKPPCDWAIISNCPSALNGWVNAPLSYQFHATEYGDPTPCHLLAGPGTIDTISGLWQYNPALSDLGKVYPLKVYAPTWCFTQPIYCLDGRGNACSTTVAINGYCGDANNDSKINLLDVSKIINCLYRGEICSGPAQGRDINGDGSVNLLDISYLISFMYRGGPPPNCPLWS